MSLPIPSTFTSQEGAFSPGALFTFLGSLRAIFDDPSHNFEKNKDVWTSTLSLITVGLTSSFPTHSELPWNTLHEKISLTEKSLDIFLLLTKRRDASMVVFRSAGSAFTKRFFSGLLKLCYILDAWTEVEVPTEEDVPSPREMKEKTFDVLVGMSRYLGGEITLTAGSEEPPWRILKDIVSECVKQIDSLLSTTLETDALILLAFPDVQPEQSSQGDQQGGDGFKQFWEVERYKLDIPATRRMASATLLVELVARILSPALLCHWYISDLVRLSFKISRRLFDLLFARAITMPLPTRMVLSSRTAASILRMDPLLPISQAAGHTVVSLWLSWRLRHEPPAPNTQSELILLKAMTDGKESKVAKADILSVIQIANKRAWTDEDDSLRELVICFLSRHVNAVGADILFFIKDMISQDGFTSYSAPLLESIEQRLLVISAQEVTISVQNEPASVPTAWRKSVKDTLEAIIAPDVVTWMDDDSSTTDTQYAWRAVDDLNRSLASRSSQGYALESRSVFISRICAFCCLLAHPDAPCTYGSGPSKTSLLTCCSVLPHLIDGTEPAQVRAHACNMLRLGIRHQHSQASDDLGDATAFILKHLGDPDRSVRLGAGRALAELCTAYQRADPGESKEIDQIFLSLQRLLDTSKEHVKESIALAAGSVGKLTQPTMQCRAICLLVGLLGKQNPVLRGTAYLQLQSIAKHHNKTQYKLVAPYLPRIAPFLVARICSEPIMISEASKFLLSTVPSLVVTTLTYTLPHVYANCDERVLKKVSDIAGKRPSGFLLAEDTGPVILAHILLLRKPEKTDQALAFILKVLEDGAGRKTTAELAQVLFSHKIRLISELVMAMGDEDPNLSRAASDALAKYVGAVSKSPNNRHVPPDAIGDLLRENMLGVVSHLNEVLQDMHGKRTLETKKRVIRGLGPFITHVGPSINNIGSQIMVTLQTWLSVATLADAALKTWHIFITTLHADDLGSHVGPISASFVASWPVLSEEGRMVVGSCIDHIVLTVGERLGDHIHDIVGIPPGDALKSARKRIRSWKKQVSPAESLSHIIRRLSNYNITVVVETLRELKLMMTKDVLFFRQMTSGDAFDPLASQLMTGLLAAASRDNEGVEALRLLAFECIGALGALDPDRSDIKAADSATMVVLNNFKDEDESIGFVTHLMENVLVGAYASTSDMTYQTNLGFALQELCKYCNFTPSLVTPGSSASATLKARNAWKSLSKRAHEVLTPLLISKYTISDRPLDNLAHPIYLSQKTYRQWMKQWMLYLISRCSGERAQRIFGVLRAVVRSMDTPVALRILPHLVLHTIISGNQDEAGKIRKELIAVLEDQLMNDNAFTEEKRLASAEVVFMLMNHLNKWVRIVRQELNRKKAESARRSRPSALTADDEMQLTRVDSILSNIDQDLIGQAALKCKSYALALMNFERRVILVRERTPQSQDLQSHYERLHQIYAHLDEPDGMEGISTLIIAPSIEHQIRQHETSGRWTAAQSCWEVRLQQSPDTLEFHLGLLRCLRNLGHYDTLRTHVKGALTRHPDWEPVLADYQAEGSWMVGDWEDVQQVLGRSQNDTAAISMARVLLSMRDGTESAVSSSLSTTRLLLGAPIVSAGVNGYRRCYEAVINLHLVHELEMIHQSPKTIPTQHRRQSELSETLASRLHVTLPNFRTREPILSLHRTAFRLMRVQDDIEKEIALSWLMTAKNARREGHSQTAYSAVLQAQQCRDVFSFRESAKLTKRNGEPLRALQELENAMRTQGWLGNQTIDIEPEEAATARTRIKTIILRARWMNETERYKDNETLAAFQLATNDHLHLESSFFHLGNYYDQHFKAVPDHDKHKRGVRMAFQTVKNFMKAIKYGSKHVYRAVPRILTLWLDLGEASIKDVDAMRLMMAEVKNNIFDIPVYKWYTAFPQIVSRIGHLNPEVYDLLAALIISVIQQYPHQALWGFVAVIKSKKQEREKRGHDILNRIRNDKRNRGTGVPALVNESIVMVDQLLGLCDRPVRDEKRGFSMQRDFPQLKKLAPSSLIIPLQESLTASLPPTSSSDDDHRPFEINAPVFHDFYDEIEVMRSLAKPRKISILGNNGQTYMFLGKPKDDLRKDARLMDFDAILNKLLRTNMESRRRRLHIRTYGVVTLNEECGFIQWVPNTIPIRSVLIKHYDARGIRSWTTSLNVLFDKIKEQYKNKTEHLAIQTFLQEVLSQYPPVFHEWFLDTFPEPQAWLNSRLNYGRTAAVMCMVGWILGLGDRHGENILLDTNTGDVVHVDFNCLFDKGRTLETPERVPFRLTQNVMDGLGITGVEGVFRIAAEISLQLLRDNRDTLMSVLDAFVHDPLVEWEDWEKRNKRGDRNNVKHLEETRKSAKTALGPIGRKLQGFFSETHVKESTTSNLVEALIQQATEPTNLARMYPGWCSWH